MLESNLGALNAAQDDAARLAAKSNEPEREARFVEEIIVDAHTDDEPKRMLGNNIFIRNSDKYYLNTIFLK